MERFGCGALIWEGDVEAAIAMNSPEALRRAGLKMIICRDENEHKLRSPEASSRAGRQDPSQGPAQEE